MVDEMWTILMVELKLKHTVLFLHFVNIFSTEEWNVPCLDFLVWDTIKVLQTLFSSFT